MQNQNQQGNQSDNNGAAAQQNDDPDFPRAFILERSSNVLIEELNKALSESTNDESGRALRAIKA